MRRFLLTLVLLCGSIFLLGCDTAADRERVRSTVSLINVVNYGNGVYYIPGVGSDVGNTLSAFVAAHPDKRVVALAPNDTGPYGVTTGYFVVVQNVNSNQNGDR